MKSWISLLVIALALAVTGAATGGTAGTAVKQCDYKGPTWRISGHKGTAWVLLFRHTTCAFGKRYAKRLALDRTPTRYGVNLVGRPRGWHCESLEQTAKWVYSGRCAKGGVTYFEWHPLA